MSFDGLNGLMKTQLEKRSSPGKNPGELQCEEGEEGLVKDTERGHSTGSGNDQVCVVSGGHMKTVFQGGE